MKIIQTYSSYGMSDKILLDCFYWGFELENGSIIENLLKMGMLNQHYEVSTTLLYRIIKTKKEA